MNELIKQASENPPLSNNKQHELLRAWQNKGDMEARDKLIMSHMQFMIKFCHRYRSFNIPLDDLVQQCILGLMKAADKFNFKKLNKEGKPFTFLTYGTWQMRRFIQDSISVSRPIRQPKNIKDMEKYQPAYLFTDIIDDSMRLSDAGYTPPDVLATDDELEYLFGGVSDRIRSMVIDRINGLYLHEIGSKHGLTAERVRQLCNKTYKQILENKNLTF